MAEAKTKPASFSVDSFLDKATDEKTRKDCEALIDMMEQATGEKATMWGTAIIGFASYHYKYESGREGDICLVGFSPRKANLALYIGISLPGSDVYLDKLGKHTTGKGCLYIKKLSDVNTNVLQELIERSVLLLKEKHNNILILINLF